MKGLALLLCSSTLIFFQIKGLACLVRIACIILATYDDLDGTYIGTMTWKHLWETIDWSVSLFTTSYKNQQKSHENQTKPRYVDQGVFSFFVKGVQKAILRREKKLSTSILLDKDMKTKDQTYLHPSITYRFHCCV